MKRVVAAAIFDEDKILLCRKSRLPYYIFPGGKPEQNDKNDIDTLVREIGEELETAISETNFIGIFNSEAPDGEPISVRMYDTTLCEKPTPNAEIIEILWYDIKSNKKLLYPFTPMTQMFIDYLKEEM